MNDHTDPLADVGPYGSLTAIGWASSNLEYRRQCIIEETRLRLAGAAETILMATIVMEPTRAAALKFVAHSLTDTARLLERMQQAETCVAKASAVAEEAQREKRRKPRSATPGDEAPARLQQAM